MICFIVTPDNQRMLAEHCGYFDPDTKHGMELAESSPPRRVQKSQQPCIMRIRL